MSGIGRIAMILAIIAILAGVALAASFFGTMGENKTVDTTKDNMATAAAIPLIDTLTPVRIETATFALG
ncbi:hypothetical protein ACFLXF_00695 [Chloroflexota bacterium]